jgi:hypothetical protein
MKHYFKIKYEDNQESYFYSDLTLDDGGNYFHYPTYKAIYEDGNVDYESKYEIDKCIENKVWKNNRMDYTLYYIGEK